MSGFEPPGNQQAKSIRVVFPNHINPTNPQDYLVAEIKVVANLNLPFHLPSQYPAAARDLKGIIN